MGSQINWYGRCCIRSGLVYFKGNAMTQNHSNSGKIDRILMTMAIHNLKKAVIAAGGVLNLYSQEANKKLMYTSEAKYIADQVAGMQLAGRNMLLCIDEILVTMEKTNTSLESYRADTQSADGGYPVASKQAPHVLANGKYANSEYACELPVSPPNKWNM